ncbi:uncharacterized protein LACBIDRAFT_325894 [Laccaria bicolor S238N-H82]|uniref:Predicted protein n=1 Tax=Laccaria bicolor (strain S238N-H82 / ATCC MYA-4686) TaxID=486041 RepID=B0D6L3_LACBS|nr:uncharacterized protein LACBIDRAFT_325894 [Laccaria bicolor S238N-H82]EDR10206.1 predicted protein [Laccaria bicolor S238N-H82]|eukprot:XP_001879591.1 predicted protein [Laccaria bicolor S238N-H82]
MEALPPVKSEEPPRVTASSLAAGNVMTRKKNFTIILVGETGTGKTSFLSLLVNVLAGKSPSKYNLEPYDVTNEYGGGQNHSQTKTAKVYEFTSLNNKDKEHKESITTAIRENIPELTAVIILANGTSPRLGVATDYAITTLCSIFPWTLAENIGILFTNISNHRFLNFEVNTLPLQLRGAKRFLMDNPLARRKSYLKNAKAEAEGDTDEDDEDIAEAEVSAGHQTTLKMLVKIFNWIDGLQPQATNDITSLYDASIEIEYKITNTLARMTQLAEAKDVLDKLVEDSNGTELTDSGAANFKKVIQKGTWTLQDTDTYNTTCQFSLCYTNCQEKCSGGFTLLGRWKLIKCRKLAYYGGTCIECSHSMKHHLQGKKAWYEKLEKINCIDETTTIAEVLKTIDTCNENIEEATAQIGRLAEQYSELSLSGSFSGQVGKSVRLIETHLESIRNRSDPESAKRIEESLNVLKKKLRLLEDAAEAARKKVYHPTSAD